MQEDTVPYFLSVALCLGTQSEQLLLLEEGTVSQHGAVNQVAAHFPALRMQKLSPQSTGEQLTLEAFKAILKEKDTELILQEADASSKWSRGGDHKSHPVCPPQPVKDDQGGNTRHHEVLQH